MIVTTTASVCALARQNLARDPPIGLNLKSSASSGPGQKKQSPQNNQRLFQRNTIFTPRSPSPKTLKVHLKTSTQTT